MKGGETQTELGLVTRNGDREQAARVPQNLLHQPRLSDARFTREHQGAAHARPKSFHQPLQATPVNFATNKRCCWGRGHQISLPQTCASVARSVRH